MTERGASKFDVDGLQVVRFVSGSTHYAVDIQEVVEVLNPIVPVAVPAAPAFVEGIVELRGRFYPLIDLRRRFGQDGGEIGKIVIVRLGETTVGLGVDSVIEVSRIGPDELIPPPVSASAGREAPFSAVVKRGDEVVFILDLTSLLSEQEQRSISSVESVG